MAVQTHTELDVGDASATRDNKTEAWAAAATTQRVSHAVLTGSGSQACREWAVQWIQLVTGSCCSWAEGARPQMPSGSSLCRREQNWAVPHGKQLLLLPSHCGLLAVVSAGPHARLMQSPNKLTERHNRIFPPNVHTLNPNEIQNTELPFHEEGTPLATLLTCLSNAFMCLRKIKDGDLLNQSHLTALQADIIPHQSRRAAKANAPDVHNCYYEVHSFLSFFFSLFGFGPYKNNILQLKVHLLK